MNIQLNCYPEGKTKALTMSYDDGRQYDRRLVEIFNQNGIRGTFHLNSGLLNQDEYVNLDEIRELYANHEISSHTVTHPDLLSVPREAMIQEILNDRIALEKRAGYTVRGMSYPFGTYDQTILALLPSLGIEYARTVVSTLDFRLPKNFLEWHPTCHHSQNMLDRYRQFAALPPYVQLPVLYIWGHSYEFHDQGSWELIEEGCKAMSHNPDVWYATNIEIVDYVNALKALRFSADASFVQNSSAIPVWIRVEGQVTKIPAGATVQF